MFFQCNSLLAQTPRKTLKNFEKAKVAYRQGDNVEAIKFAKMALKSDNYHIDSHLLLADIYNLLDSVQPEITHLEFVNKHSKRANSLVGFRLGEALFQSGDYAKGLKVLLETQKMEGLSERRKSDIHKRILSCEFALKAIENPIADSAKKLPGNVNSKQNEYWPSIGIEGNSLVFTRLENNLNFQQEDLFISFFENEVWGEAIPLTEINTDENEGAQSLTADGNLLFFAACNRNDGLGSCDIYYTRKINGTWEKPKNAGKPISSQYWESQPSVTANGNYLYFSSNRKGGKGKMDIWRCRLNGFDDEGDPRWGQPENLSNNINTSGNENSPYIHFNGKDLYFSSDELTGMGGADIFHSELSERGWSTPENIGYPINTSNDEQGLVIDATGKKAYYVSDQEGNMDIYSFDLYEKVQPDPVSYVKGNVADIVTKKPLVAEVQFTQLGKNYSEKIWSDSRGNFLLALPLLNNYAFNVDKEGYLFYSDALELEGIYQLNEPFKLEIELQPVIEGAKMVLNNIYFQTDSYELLPESDSELEKLKDLLLNNPEICIEIEGHTDNVGNEEYNLKLSENRAKAVYDFLINTGIDDQRLSFNGYGYSNPIAGNDSEEGRKKNRRTQIRILKSN